MLALNETLQKTGQPPSIWVSKIGYSQSGTISALLTEKADTKKLLKMRKNILIRAAKAVNAAVIGAETLEHWHCLKVHGMPLKRYLGEEKMELFRKEVELSTGIELKTISQWLIYESRLKEKQESENYRGSSIVITVVSSSEATHLAVKRLRFGGIFKVVERYWEAGPRSVYQICCEIGYDRFGKCGKRPAKYTIYAGLTS